MFKKVSKEKILQSVENLPVLSEVVSRCMTMLSDPNSSIRDLTELISKDQSITAKIIRIANSAFYGYSRQIKTLSEAIVILGFRQIRTLLITASSANHLSCKVEGYMIAQGDLWKHSYAVAFTSGLISRLTNIGQSDEIFTVGILHDIGKLVLGNHLKGSYREIISLTQDKNVNFAVAEEQILGIHHAEVGGLILAHWNFPEVMTESVRMHHHPLDAHEISDQVGMLNLADNWVRESGIGVGINGNMTDGLEGSILKNLKIKEGVKKQVLDYLNDEMKQMEDLFPSSQSSVKLVEMSKKA
ncbi:HDOD domain-containing protein [bacterium]|nr:HDOD domain-containing protein [bacterium]MBU1024741.1 HDOD domain-containing protein [bacterium]